MTSAETAAVLAQLPDDAEITVTVKVGDWLRARQAANGGPEYATPLPLANQTAIWELPVTGAPAFVGLEFYVQAVVLAPGWNPLSLIVSNAGRGRRHKRRNDQLSRRERRRRREQQRRRRSRVHRRAGCRPRRAEVRSGPRAGHGRQFLRVPPERPQ